MTYCKYKVCSRCRQTALFIMRRQDSGMLYLHCEECEWAWDYPDDVESIAKGFLGLEVDGEYATQGEVDDAGWVKYGIQCTTSR